MLKISPNLETFFRLSANMCFGIGKNRIFLLKYFDKFGVMLPALRFLTVQLLNKSLNLHFYCNVFICACSDRKMAYLSSFLENMTYPNFFYRNQRCSITLSSLYMPSDIVRWYVPLITGSVLWKILTFFELLTLRSG